jgi:hypothetical protein
MLEWHCSFGQGPVAFLQTEPCGEKERIFNLRKKVYSMVSLTLAAAFGSGSRYRTAFRAGGTASRRPDQAQARAAAEVNILILISATCCFL